jgi:hypothetical protein
MNKASTKIIVEIKANSQAAGRRLSKFKSHSEGNKKKLASKVACRGSKTTRLME